MTMPNKLPIKRMEDYHTHYLGQVADGRLFWGYQTFVFNKQYSDIPKGDNWQRHKKEYVLMHTFDKEGNYMETVHWFAGFTADTSQQQIDNKLQELFEDLGDTVFCNIEIKIFQTQIDNITFGLVVDQQNGMINLQPGSAISFREPWDGEYYT